jgi:hypothetical protein
LMVTPPLPRRAARRDVFSSAKRSCPGSG